MLNFKNNPYHILPFFLFPLFFLLVISPARAENLFSDPYRIQMSTINITGGNKSGGGYKLGDTVGQTVQGLFSGSGYKVKAGFQYINTKIPFTFIISSLSINFDVLIPNVFSSNTHNLTVTAGGGYGYAVKAIENHPLALTGSSATIPNTACDPATPCTISTANVWTGPTNNGFGYNMSGTDVDTAVFVNSTYYRPFPNNTLGQSPATVMSKSGVTLSSLATVTYKVSVSPTQEAGDYENAIQYIAIPAY
jgi:hypothetical protein